MILTYSKAESLAVAVEKTFDGQHPCDDCRNIQSAKKQEEEKSAPSFKSEKKVESLTEASVQNMFFSMPGSIWFGRDATLMLYRADSPPFPPPRGSSIA
jgi:hypothetical protein